MKKRIVEKIVNGSRDSDERVEFSRPLRRIVAQQEAEARRKERKSRFERRTVDSVFWWHMFDMLILGGPFAAIVIYAVWGGMHDEQIPVWTGVALMFWLIAFVRQQRRFGRFKCRECERILWPELEEQKPIIFRCHECKIDFDIGFHHSTD